MTLYENLFHRSCKRPCHCKGKTSGTKPHKLQVRLSCGELFSRCFEEPICLRLRENVSALTLIVRTTRQQVLHATIVVQSPRRWRESGSPKCLPTSPSQHGVMTQERKRHLADCGGLHVTCVCIADCSESVPHTEDANEDEFRSRTGAAQTAAVVR